MYEIYCKLRDAKGVKDGTVAAATGITRSTFADWKKGRSEPKRDKLQKIANYFGVSIDYLMTGEEPDEEHYYLNPEARELAEFLFHHPEYKTLFDASRKVRPEDIKFVIELLERMSGKTDT